MFDFDALASQHDSQMIANKQTDRFHSFPLTEAVLSINITNRFPDISADVAVTCKN